MDFRAQPQDNEMRTSGSLSYASSAHHLSTKESSPAAAAAAADHQKRRVGIHNGNNTYATSPHQTLDHHIQHPHPPSQPLIRDPDPDRALAGTPVPPTVLASGGPKSTSKIIRYRECLKNHAANIGGNVFDGCGEFMPSGGGRGNDGVQPRVQTRKHNAEPSPTPPASAVSFVGSPPSPPHHQKFSMAPIIQPMNVAFGSGGGGTESSSEDLNVFQSNNAEGGFPMPPFAMSKKRFRTKFTLEQKERMMEFAEKVGWRIQKQDEEEVERFCAEVGVKRQVLRVWMHNNKNSAKKQSDILTTPTTTSLSFENVEAEEEGGGEGGRDNS
ncbi:zinc-finger homeodomain protein 5 isoform X1 [Prunus yedoensis var. nudiflora]|uniref:Zinc-finger homeodomain protein 5 isoform X1 n=1 Tax=Prunus yedoensis var. nudiflora TaxID=2094558 RepID=A0A314YFS7_PRUYE|nr:zinc-finger homeodomain protein 5 isoform X1 [Prunus yedoensis var. nudiflora]